MVTGPTGLGPEKDCAGEAQQHDSHYTHPLAREGAHNNNNKEKYLQIISREEKEKLVTGSGGSLKEPVRVHM
jgi:hypothetical protein